jgi:hypothetical protein
MNTFSFLIVWAALFAAPGLAAAQGCPAPVNVQNEVLPGPPPVLHVTWDAPPNTNVLGYLFVYSIDGSPNDTLYLPFKPTELYLPLPTGWMTLNATLLTVCADGSISVPVSIRRTTIILEDLVLLKHKGSLEEYVCTNHCPRATHFRYRNEDGSDINPELSGFYQIGTFCLCMQAHNNDFDDPAIVQYCRNAALETAPVSDLIVVSCYGNATANRNSGVQAVETWVIPNPVSDRFLLVLSAAESGTARCTLLDLRGAVLLEKEVALGKEESAGVEFSAGHLPRGLYLLRIQEPQGRQTTLRIVRW